MLAPFTDPESFSSPLASIEDGLDAYAGNPRYQQLSSELRALLFATAQTTCPTRVPTPRPEARSDPDVQPAMFRHFLDLLSSRSTHISILESAKYLRAWVAECAPWLDMFDRDRAFGLQIPCLAQKSPAVLYALLAVSARQVENQKGARTSSRDSLELYSEAIASLSAALEERDPCILVAACILCVLEMMSASPTDWQRHLEGCATLIDASGVHGLCGGIDQAVFWCFARMDLCAAIISNGVASTVLPIEKWALVPGPRNMTPDGSEHGQAVREAFVDRAEHNPDMYANYMVYLCAKVCDLLARRTRHVELGEANGFDHEHFSRSWRWLWDELQLWSRARSSDMLPLKVAMDSQQIPRTFFAQYPAISGNQLYHTACILMLEMQPTTDSGLARERSDTVLWHARQIVGISLANEHRGCLNNAIQPLYVAGKLFTHKAQHDVVAQLLNDIEAGSGWAARWRIRDLEVAWGYPKGTYT